jgi:4,5-DOPA dioxygenase extradiol
MPDLMPLVFIGHGSPMNVVQQNDFTWSLSALGKQVRRPSCILCISAHWETEGTFVTGADHPKQIYDFYGFPDELYEIRYSPHGSLETANRISALGPIALSTHWGIDHGSWAVLKHIYPLHDIPVIQLSLDATKNEQEHFALASLLLPLRSEGVLIIGSGNIVHNLRLMSWQQFGEEPFDWARTFDLQVKEALEKGDNDPLVRYDARDRDAADRSVPTNEHYLPLLYIAALRQKGEEIEFIHEGFQHRSVSMRSFLVRERTPGTASGRKR